MDAVQRVLVPAGIDHTLVEDDAFLDGDLGLGRRCGDIGVVGEGVELDIRVLGTHPDHDLVPELDLPGRHFPNPYRTRYGS